MSSMECVFCQIIHRRAPASMVYEDTAVVAFLSNRPVNVGHTLVVPKKHYTDIYEMPDNEAAYLFEVAKRVAQAVKDATGNAAIRIVQNNGADAGQVIFHVHVHVIPMKSGNHLLFENQLRTSELLDKDAENIRSRLK